MYSDPSREVCYSSLKILNCAHIQQVNFKIQTIILSVHRFAKFNNVNQEKSLITVSGKKLHMGVNV